MEDAIFYLYFRRYFSSGGVLPPTAAPFDVHRLSCNIRTIFFDDKD